MPYIAQAERRIIDHHLKEVAQFIITPGQLNYAITKLVHEFLPLRARYADYNQAIGVLECAKLELYRMQVGPYEDTAIAKNGPVT